MRVVLELDHVVTGRGGRDLHRPVSLRAGIGELYELHGINGIGKSTLLLSIAGVRQHKSGTIRRRASTIGFAPQSAAFLCGLTLREAQRLTGADSRRYQELRETCFPTIPNGMDSVMARLSYGQLQAIKLVLCGARRADLVLLDEPAAGLDAKVIEGVAPFVSELLKTAAVIAVTHETDETIGLLAPCGATYVHTVEVTN